ncbi:hypothetical protein QBC43DRAFT_338285 [Cladorrhinum sp. PSN259]|nr:hypothetical protein QBC43DRAFT_338285 [Cladorrhinum sp. PSN259]
MLPTFPTHYDEEQYLYLQIAIMVDYLLNQGYMPYQIMNHAIEYWSKAEPGSLEQAFYSLLFQEGWRHVSGIFKVLQHISVGMEVLISRWHAHCASSPIDGVKTRMQLVNHTASGVYAGVTQSTYKMASTEGVLNLWRGMSSVNAGADPAHAVYFATYEAVKHRALGYFLRPKLPLSHIQLKISL